MSQFKANEKNKIFDADSFEFKELEIEVDKKKLVYSEFILDFEIFNLWQFGDWENLSAIDTDGSEDKAALKLSAQLQLGEIENAKISLANLTTKPSMFLAKILISGVYNTLARSKYLLGKKELAQKYFKESIELGADLIDPSLAIKARQCEQLLQLDYLPHWTGLTNLNKKGQSKKLFIDCGGHDGCSVIKFKLLNPTYDIITFEGNPELWPYYEKMPTKLIKKLVSNYNGEVEFIIDPVDADGSSIIKEKKIDVHQNVKNDDCPKIVTACVNLSEFVKEQSEFYSEIILKLDVEGAEYMILEQMYQDDTLKHVNKLYIEFHYKKINYSKEKHDALLKKIIPYFEIEDWDAAEFQVHRKDNKTKEIRQQILNLICK